MAEPALPAEEPAPQDRSGPAPRQRVIPRYPESQKHLARGSTQRCSFALDIDASGAVTNIESVDACPADFVAEAEPALRQWTFWPALDADGTAQPSPYTVTFRWKRD